MEFSLFKNRTEYLEYLQIFCFQSLIKDGKENVDIEDYKKFRLLDTLINAYDDWVKKGSPEKEKIESWFIQYPDKVKTFKDGFGKEFLPKPSIWSDRKKNEYYESKLQDSFMFENYIANKIYEDYGIEIGAYLTPQGQYELGENALGIELKNDTLFERYGNIYIEYAEKSNGTNYDYIASGILKKDNCKYFLLGTAAQFYIFRKSRLLEIYHEEIAINRGGKPSPRGIKFKQIATSKGIAYPIRNALAETISMDTMIAEITRDLGLKVGGHI